MSIGYIFYVLIIIIIHDCSSSSSSLLERLRKHKTIAFQSSLSSSIDMTINEGSKFRLTCSFLSNFDQIDLFWFHNETLIQSFISKTIFEEEDDNVEDSFLAVTIISTIEIEKSHWNINGLYQCIAVHDDVYSQQNFHVQIIPHESNLIKTNFSEDALFTVHTYQSLFEPRSYTSLMCRVGGNRKDKCTIQWFDPEDELLDTLEEKSDLVLKDATFEDHMGLYTCQVCCQNQCQRLTSFVYPAGAEN